MPLHIDPGYIFCKDWVESPSLGRWGFWMYTAHFYSDPGSLFWALQRWCKPQINQQVPHPWHLSGLLTCSPKLGPPYRGALQGPTVACRIGLVYGELCFWLRGAWRLQPCVSPFAASGKNSVEALSYCSSWGKMASLRGLAETTPLCKEQLLQSKINENLPWCEAACSAMPTQTQQELRAVPVRSHPDKSLHQNWLEGRMVRFLSKTQDFYQSVVAEKQVIGLLLKEKKLGKIP